MPADKPDENGDHTPLVLWGDTVYTKGMFRYTLPTIKTRYISEYYEQLGKIDSFLDVPALWEKEYDAHNTLGEEILSLAITSAKTMICFAHLADEKELVLTKKQQASVRESVKQIQDHFESEEALHDYLSTFGMDKASLEAYYSLQIKSEAAQEYYFNANTGIQKVSEKEAMAYFKENFATLKHIFLNYEKGWEEKRDEIKAGLDEGKDIESFATYSQDGFFDSFADGMLVYEGSTGFKTYEKAALKLKVGKSVVLEDTDGVYIMCRYANKEDAFASPLSQESTLTIRDLIVTLLTNEKIRKTVEDQKNLVLDASQIKGITTINSPLIH